MVGKSAVIYFIIIIIIIYTFAIDLREDRSAILVIGKEGRETNSL